MFFDLDLRTRIYCSETRNEFVFRILRFDRQRNTRWKVLILRYRLCRFGGAEFWLPYFDANPTQQF